MKIILDPHITDQMTVEKVRARCHHYYGKGLVVGAAIMLVIGGFMVAAFETIVKG